MPKSPVHHPLPSAILSIRRGHFPANAEFALRPLAPVHIFCRSTAVMFGSNELPDVLREFRLAGLLRVNAPFLHATSRMESALPSGLFRSYAARGISPTIAACGSIILFGRIPNMNSSDVQIFATISVLAGCIVTIFWMVVGWRAMRAHEQIAHALMESTGHQAEQFRAQKREDSISEEKAFREFLKSDPLAQHLDAHERARRFAEWIAMQR